MSYHLTVNIEAAGTHTAEGSSPAGHMWYSLDDGSGNPPKNYGFGPLPGATGVDRVIGQGRVYDNDDTKYTGDPAYSQTIEITEDQYNAMKNFGDDPTANGNFDLWYDVGDNSCVDFVYKALELAGLNPMGREGSLIPMDNKSIINYLLTGMYVYLGGADLLAEIQELFDEAAAMLVPQGGDPIILDLDGDGVETASLAGGAYFDHDRTGFAEKTGWAGTDDGLLVMDRNSNGIVDDGKELFGSDTLLQNGQRAANGFEALAELDTNSDGKIDANDAGFSQLRVWRDLDGDGYSASDELFTLDELGIQSVNTGYTTSTYVDEDGNEHRQVGTYTKTDSTTLTATDVWFQTDPTYTIANELLDVPTAIAALPDLQGYGNTYDLHQAMVRDTTGTLQGLVEQFMAETDFADRNALMEQILFKWTGSDGINPASRGGLFDARKLAVLETLFGKTFVGTSGEDPHAGAVPFLERSYKGIFEMFYAQLMAQTHLKNLYDDIGYTWDETSQSIKGDLTGVITDIQNALTADWTAGKIELAEFSRTLYGFQAQDKVDLLAFRSAFAAQGEELVWLIDSAGRGAAEGTAGNDYMTADDVNSALAGGEGDDNLSAGCGDGGSVVLYGNAGADYLTGGEGDDILNGGTGNDQLEGGGGNDLLEGGHGNDQLSGGDGSDTYLFNLGDGQDTIYEYDQQGSTDTDRIKFGPGITRDDILINRRDNDLVVEIQDTTDSIAVAGWYDQGAGDSPKIEVLEFSDGTTMTRAEIESLATFRGTDGNDNLGGPYDTDDRFEGGHGNDQLNGGDGSDTYLFNLGDGQDTIYDYDQQGSTDTDRIKFGPGITRDDILITRSGTSVGFEIKNTTDSITVAGWYDQGVGDSPKIELLEFTDGTTMTRAEIESEATFRGTDGNDNLGGPYDTDDRFEGGHGNDQLSGGDGSDTYLFNLGDGQDTIYDYDQQGSTDTDRIKFGPGITRDDILISRRDNDLVVEIQNTTDSIAVAGWYDQGAGDAPKIEVLEFSDGTTMTRAEIESLVVIRGTAGVDYLSGFEGNDTIDGCGGDDYLYGDAGNDTYLFGRGSGHDVVTESAGSADKIKLASDIATGDVELWRDQSNLYIGIVGTGDVLTVQNWYDDQMYRVEQIEFSDGTVWGTSIMLAAVFKGTDGNDNIYGTTGSNVMEGRGGNDYLYADAGNDTLDGGTGNDTLDGGSGNDTYIFGEGYGQDTIMETSGTDVVNFSAEVLPGEVMVSRDANNLYFEINGGADRLTIQNFYSGSAYRVETFHFNDGTTWDLNTINSRFVTPTENADFLWGSAGNNTINGLGGDDRIMGNEGNDTLIGGAGNDTLNGGYGVDTMTGGIGDDTYVVDQLSDVLNENANEGIDTVESSITYTLGTNFENLTLIGTGAINGTGNSVDNVLTGNSGNNVLDGGVGADTMIGGAGDDTFVIDNAGDVVTENAEEGTDTVKSSLTYTLGANVEKLTLTGSSAINGTGNDLNNTITGNSAANTLTGGAGNDTLNGGAGADTMIGGTGNDTYTIDNVGDVAVENADEGTDTIRTSFTFTLADNFENLTLTGSSAINGTGNDVNNAITGNSAANTLTGGAGNDTLNGGAGADTMIGGTGNDTYVVDNAGDVVTENAEEGTDTVQSSITYTLGTAFENLTLTGGSAVNGSGNDLDNTITGNSAANTLVGGAGNDTLNGGTGADTMIGGTGDDTYVVDQTGDVVTENAGEGVDTVQTILNYTLGANVENLTLTGTGWANGTGNALDNVLTGNSGNNTLDGGAGNDTLNGGAGSDTMVGGTGNDTYYVNTSGDAVTENAGEGTDTVMSSATHALGANVENLTLTGSSAINGTGNGLDNVLAGNSANNTLNGGVGNDTYAFSLGGGSDTVTDAGADAATQDLILFNNDVLQGTVAFFQSGQNLMVGYGSTETINVTSQFQSDSGVERIQLENGLFLTDADISQVIQNINAFAASHGITLTSVNDVRNNADLMSIVASSWHA